MYDHQYDRSFGIEKSVSSTVPWVFPSFSAKAWQIERLPIICLVASQSKLAEDHSKAFAPLEFGKRFVGRQIVARAAGLFCPPHIDSIATPPPAPLWL